MNRQKNMYRQAEEYLKEWKTRPARKPLVIRGARQVGKSYLVRQFARSEFRNLLEINLETDRNILPYFEKQNVSETLSLLSLQYGQPVTPGDTLLFLDEIQAAPHLLAKLRYVHEQVPGLHVIAAGSLLEFALKKHEYSMPVGRIEYLHLGPMTFDEFLMALGHRDLAGFIGTAGPSTEVPLPLHDKLNGLVRLYMAVGGMPESVAAYAATGSYRDTDRILASILATYADDFNKYAGSIDLRRLHLLFDAIPRLVGATFKYTQVSRDERSRDLAAALRMLALARVCHQVFHSDCNGVPLGATTDERKFKLLCIDVGLMCSACGLTMLDIERIEDLTLANAGSVSEQFIGQHLLYRDEPYREPQLHYWVRQKSTSNAEVDFVISRGTAIIPVEVKSGTTGTLKSLHQFMHEKKGAVAVRCNMDIPAAGTISGRLTTGEAYQYRLVSLPLYLAGHVTRILGGLTADDRRHG